MTKILLLQYLQSAEELENKFQLIFELVISSHSQLVTSFMKLLKTPKWSFFNLCFVLPLIPSTTTTKKRESVLKIINVNLISYHLKKKIKTQSSHFPWRVLLKQVYFNFFLKHDIHFENDGKWKYTVSSFHFTPSHY